VRLFLLLLLPMSDRPARSFLFLDSMVQMAIQDGAVSRWLRACDASDGRRKHAEVVEMDVKDEGGREDVGSSKRERKGTEDRAQHRSVG
jgi:hypothetical protein